jgi:tRNA-2-methylthio-N6-dimethylallyladenosine synthase
MDDDVDEIVKTRRLVEIVELQNEISEKKNSASIGNKYEVLIESISKKSPDMLKGRTDGNKAVIIPKNGTNVGDKVLVKITRSNSATLFGEAVHN